MKSVIYILQWLSDNQLLLILIIGLIIGIYFRIKSWNELSKREKFNIICKKLDETIDSLVFEAECKYDGTQNAGTVKRAEVINKIYEKYPDLQKVVNQEYVIEIIDDLIDEALERIDEIKKNNK